jgi:hypothetical protein
MAPIEASMQDCFDEDLTEALWLETQTATSVLNTAIVAYLLNRTPETTQTLIRAIDKSRALELRLRAAITAEYGLLQ